MHIVSLPTKMASCLFIVSFPDPLGANGEKGSGDSGQDVVQQKNVIMQWGLAGD